MTATNQNVRLARIKDLDALCLIEIAAWGNGAAKRQTIAGRLANDAIQTILVYSDRGNPLAFAQIMWTSPKRIATCGYKWGLMIQEGGEANGKLAYGFNLSAVPSRNTAGAGKVALEGALGAVIRRNGEGFVAGGRLPGFRGWEKRCTAEVYSGLALASKNIFFADFSNRNFFYCCPNQAAVRNPIPPLAQWKKVPTQNYDHFRRSLHFIDPFVRLISEAHCAGHRCHIDGVVPDYFVDPSSCNFGLWYYWVNPFASDTHSFLNNVTNLPYIRRVSTISG